jgi:hypothetical protein
MGSASGILYKQDLIHREIATESFGFYVCRWWKILKGYVENQRKIYEDDPPSLFDKFQYVAQEMKHPNDGDIDAAELKQFLIDEQSVWSPCVSSE